VKGIIIVAGLAGALCFGAVAFGASVAYQGKDKDSKCASSPTACEVDLATHTHKGKVRKVDFVIFKAVPAHCDEGSNIFNNYEPPVVDWHVSGKRKFHGSFEFNFGDAKAHVKGRFSKNFKTATGTLHATGTINGIGTYTNCDSGTDHYKVHRGS
jgi:hypothetical protein